MGTALNLRSTGQEDVLKGARLLGQAVRVCEALLFASREPLSEDVLAQSLPQGVTIREVMQHLQTHYASRGVNLKRIGSGWAFRTADDLGYLMAKEVEEPKKLSRAAIETLSIIAYHQPVTRAEIEEIRGVATAKGTLDVLLETGWVRMRGRRKTPGRPITFGTTEAFLSHFNLSSIGDLPGLDELKAAGMLDGRVSAQLRIPLPSDDPTLREDEDPLEGDPLLLAAEERLNEAEDPLEDEETADIDDPGHLDPLDGEHPSR